MLMLMLIADVDGNVKVRMLLCELYVVNHIKSLDMYVPYLPMSKCPASSCRCPNVQRAAAYVALRALHKTVTTNYFIHFYS